MTSRSTTSSSMPERIEFAERQRDCVDALAWIATQPNIHSGATIATISAPPTASPVANSNGARGSASSGHLPAFAEAYRNPVEDDEADGAGDGCNQPDFRRRRPAGRHPRRCLGDRIKDEDDGDAQHSHPSERAQPAHLPGISTPADPITTMSPPMSSRRATDGVLWCQYTGGTAALVPGARLSTDLGARRREFAADRRSDFLDQRLERA